MHSESSTQASSGQSSRASLLFLNLFFAYVGVMTFVNGVIATHDLQNWIVSDWLINYQGGFVRRGLMGQGVFLLAHLSHLPPIFFVAVCYMSLYAVLILCFRRLTLSTRLDVWIFALVVSPAVLSFQLLHRWAGFRKDIICLAALSLFLVLLQKKKLSTMGISIFLTVYLVVSTLSHEGLIFYSPYFFAALLLSGDTLGQTARRCIVPALVGILAVAACVTHPGNATQAAQICSSIGYKLVLVPGSTEICASGAIPYLAKTREVAAHEAAAKILHYQYFELFPAFAALALLPVAGESIVLARAGKGREIRILWITAAISFVGTLVLFRYAVDWGRWIYIHVVSMTLLLLFVNARYRGLLDAVDKEKPAHEMAWGGRKFLYGLLVFLYATCWIMPSDTETLQMGYVGRVLNVLHIVPKPPNPERIPTQ